MHRIVHRHFYRSLSRVFPYGVFYTCEEETVTVYAIVDLRRDPEFIRRHLEELKTQPGEDGNGYAPRHSEINEMLARKVIRDLSSDCEAIQSVVSIPLALEKRIA